MEKITADKIALVMARDILKTNSQYQREINEHIATNVAEFIKKLSQELQENMDDNIRAAEIINAYKNQ